MRCSNKSETIQGCFWIPHFFWNDALISVLCQSHLTIRLTQKYATCATLTLDNMIQYYGTRCLVLMYSKHTVMVRCVLAGDYYKAATHFQRIIFPRHPNNCAVYYPV